MKNFIFLLGCFITTQVLFGQNEIIKQNKEKAQTNLVKQLDSIFIEDQKYREQLEEFENTAALLSKEIQDKEIRVIITAMRKKDSANLIKVKAILDKYGWLGADVVGAQGNSTLFLVIQHSDQATQEKYLPMMREAAKNGKASHSALALLEDRVALGQGKKQIYGSQIGQT